MDIDPGPSPDLGPVAGPSSEPALASLPTSQKKGRGTPRARAPLPSRQLRARPSDPGSIPSPVAKRSRSDTHTTLRAPTERELEYVTSKLSEEAIAARREIVIKEKDVELKSVVDGHDDAVREKFHLERFISIFEGWDPAVAKQDNSPVFLEYKRSNHNLLDLLPSIPPSQVAGPSRSRASFGSRTTRRRANEQAELFSSEPISQPSPVSTSRAKGKGRQSDANVSIEELELVPIKQRGRNDAMLPPPGPDKVKGKGKGRRATINIVSHEDGEDEGVKMEEPDPGGKNQDKGPGKKRGRPPGRPSLPNLPSKKLQDDEGVSGQSSPAIEPSPEPESIPSAAAIVPVLPSLAHLPFPPPPPRPRQRPRGTRKLYYTDYTQLPTTSPKYQGDIQAILDSYIHLEDTGPPPDIQSLEAKAAREAYFRNRVNYLQHQGRLLRLLDEDDAVPSNAKIGTKPPPLPARKTDYQDSLLAHMVQVRTAMLNEAKSKPVICRKIARMIQAHWDHIEGKEDRERLAEEKRRKLQMKELIKSLRKRWALAVKVVRAKLVQLQKEEQDRLGKEHLQNMLQRSTGLLDAHRDEFAGREGDEEEEESDDDEESSGTEDVSSAEDSQEEDEDDDKDGDDEEEDAEDDEEGVAADEPNGTGELNDTDPITGSNSDTAAEIVSEVAAPKEPESTINGDDVAGEDQLHAISEDSESDEDVDTRALLADETAGQDSGPEGSPEADDIVPAPAANTIGASTSVAHKTTLQVTSPAISLIPDIEGTAASANDPLDPSVATTNGSPATNHMPVSEAPVPTNGGMKHADDVSLTKASAEDHSAEVKEIESIPATRPRSKRQRAKRLVASSATPDTDDPDAGDIEFKVEQTSDIDEKDHEMDVEMEGDEADDADSEDDGLLADANLPIEELLRRYGYEMPGAAGNNGHVETKAEPAEKGDDAIPPMSAVDVDMADQSLVDAALPAASNNEEATTDRTLVEGPRPPASPQPVVEGKRHRRVRAVWTPEDNPPPPPKKPKVQVITAKGEIEPEVIEPEEEEDGSEPAFTSSEEESDEEEEEGDGDEAMDEDQESADPNRLRAPFLLRGTLRPYQHAGLEWLASLYSNNMNGILADEMGLGKTIQTISLLAHLACDKGIWGQHLIIVPTSVILNWEMEFKKFLPGMKVLTYYGNQKERKEKRIGWQTQHHFQVCITSYQIVLADQHIFRRKNWVYMILDEAHNIKNFRSQRWQTLLGFKAQRRLLLTGTPLQNNLMELWSLLYFLMPGGVAEDATAVVGFANHKEFTEWFSNPMDKAVESGDVVDEEIMATISKLHTLLRPFILRRLKSEVETQLPGKFEHVVYCRLSKRQRFLYDEFMARASTKEALTSGGYLGVVNTLMQLRKVCNHPDLFEVRPVRTSFAMDPVVGEYEPVELLVRKRSLADQDEAINLDSLNLRITDNEDLSSWVCKTRHELDASDRLPYAIEPVVTKRGKQPAHPPLDTLTVDGWLKYRAWHEEQKSIARWRSLRDKNRIRCATRPIYGSTLLSMLSDIPNVINPLSLPSTRPHSFGEHDPPASALVSSLSDRSRVLEPLVNLYAVIPPNAVARDLSRYALPGFTPLSHPALTEPSFDTLHQSTVKLQIAFPDSSLLQYDCGKLQTLYTMLRDLKANGHRVLIFTQMTRVLDILEMFLSYNGHRYLRLDGSTKIEDRQIITERFNSDSRIFCFIASSRSGGVGINLTGADTVFFYDSDWNPSMDRQCMDRAHRIGQTREVHIYRFVSTHTVEENMLKKANQKRMLDKVVIQEGEFTTDFFGKMDWRDVIDPVSTDANATEPEGKVEDIEMADEPTAVDQETLKPRAGEERELARALAEVEDEEDAAAARIAQGEGELDFEEFDGENKKVVVPKRVGFDRLKEGSGTPVTPAPAVAVEGMADEEEGEEEEDDGIGSVDEYMLKLVEWDWSFFVTYRA